MTFIVSKYFPSIRNLLRFQSHKWTLNFISCFFCVQGCCLSFCQPDTLHTLHTSLPGRNEPHLNMEHNHVDVLLDSASWCFGATMFANIFSASCLSFCNFQKHMFGGGRGAGEVPQVCQDLPSPQGQSFKISVLQITVPVDLSSSSLILLKFADNLLVSFSFELLDFSVPEFLFGSCF